MPIGNNLYTLDSNNKTESKETEETKEEPTDPKPNIRSDSATFQQREAAYCRHKPIEDLKRECILYWLQHKKLSNDQAAHKFYEGLPPEKQEILAPSNAAKTLSKALSEYKNRGKSLEKDEIPQTYTFCAQA